MPSAPATSPVGPPASPPATTCASPSSTAPWSTTVPSRSSSARPGQRPGSSTGACSVRAVEQQVNLIACNAVGEQQGVTLGGHSRVVAPTGEVLVEAGDDEGFTYARLDPDLPRRFRAEFPALADRRWPVAPTP